MGTGPVLTAQTAVPLSLCAAALWGSWMVSVKHLGGYPLDGFIVTLYSTSLIFVWGLALVLQPGALLHTLRETGSREPVRLLGVLVGGIAYVAGMRLTLVVLSTIGLSLAQPIQSSISIMAGTFIAAMVGGVREGVSLGRIMVAGAVLTCAVIVTMLAAWYRTQSDTAAPIMGVAQSMGDVWRALPLILLASLLSPAYPWALALGLHSPTQSHGIPILPFMAVLATGAFIGALLTSGVSLTRHRQWHCVLSAPFRVHRWGIGSGVFHYGGNIIHGVASSVLTASVAWPLGLSSAFWTQLWGLLHGEFKGSSAKAYIALSAALLLYCIGVSVIVTTL